MEDATHDDLLDFLHEDLMVVLVLEYRNRSDVI